MVPQIFFFFFNRCSEIDSGGTSSVVLKGKSTQSNSVLFVLWCKGDAGGSEFLTTCVRYSPLLMLFNMELLRKEIFSGGWVGGGKLVFGAGDKLVFGVRGNHRASPL